MERPALNDPDVFPDDEVLAALFGRAKVAWDTFVARAEAGFGSGVLGWKYYKDGKAWLNRLVHRKKTLCWISAWDKHFKVVFYFTAKNDAAVAALDIPDDVKENYRTYPPIGKLKPLIFFVRTKKDLDPVFTAIAYKASLK
jgi:hypothetical protein